MPRAPRIGSCLAVLHDDFEDGLQQEMLVRGGRRVGRLVTVSDAAIFGVDVTSPGRSGEW